MPELIADTSVPQIRPSDVTTVTRVTTPAEWQALQTKLDQRVRQLLDEGFEV